MKNAAGEEKCYYRSCIGFDQASLDRKPDQLRWRHQLSVTPAVPADISGRGSTVLSRLQQESESNNALERTHDRRLRCGRRASRIRIKCHRFGSALSRGVQRDR
jgi:hypothetical protein